MRGFADGARPFDRVQRVVSIRLTPNTRSTTPPLAPSGNRPIGSPSRSHRPLFFLVGLVPLFPLIQVATRGSSHEIGLDDHESMSWLDFMTAHLSLYLSLPLPVCETTVAADWLSFPSFFPNFQGCSCLNLRPLDRGSWARVRIRAPVIRSVLVPPPPQGKKGKTRKEEGKGEERSNTLQSNTTKETNDGGR